MTTYHFFLFFFQNDHKKYRSFPRAEKETVAENMLKACIRKYHNMTDIVRIYCIYTHDAVSPNGEWGTSCIYHMLNNQ